MQIADCVQAHVIHVDLLKHSQQKLKYYMEHFTWKYTQCLNVVLRLAIQDMIVKRSQDVSYM